MITDSDDEDYNDQGSGEYSTTRPKREMTEGYTFDNTEETTTEGDCF